MLPQKRSDPSQSTKESMLSQGHVIGSTSAEEEEESPQGPRYVRYGGLRKVVDYSLDTTLKQFTLEKLKECYPMIDASVLEFVRRQIVDLWRSTAESEFDKIYDDRQLEKSLNELDEIVYEAERRKEKDKDDVLHLEQLKPEQIVQSRLVDLKKESISRLDGKLDELREDYDALMKQLEGLSGQATKNVGDVETIFKELDLLNEDKDKISDEKFESLIEYVADEVD
ncbi:DEKNAAC103075 [Brettanomyces naardenensis]|uniref:DEKNAAC103075 n=1 Tax=Brettanomyces naardenensis TaxID=13370 RepID=A0A448YMD2_BRENA|nr:DEKNAAC103075 [Brettanomyces naardenensis]